MFPADDRLRDLEVEAWVGIPLNNAEGRACGLIAALYSRPLDHEIDFVQSTLTMFAPRASAELNRKRELDALQEGEQRYRAFIALNPDGFCRIEFEEPIDTTLPEEEQLDKMERTGYVAECNDALARVVGLERADQLIGAAGLSGCATRGNSAQRHAFSDLFRGTGTAQSRKHQWTMRAIPGISCAATGALWKRAGCNGSGYQSGISRS